MRRSPRSVPNVPSIMSATERRSVFDPPTDHDEAATRYSLEPDEIALTNAKRRDHNRLGFAVQLALVRDLGRTMRAGEEPPVAVVDVVADQLGVDPDAFELYGARDETRREHAVEIADLLGLRTIAQRDYRAVIAAGALTAAATERGVPIVTSIIAELKEQGILVPAPALVERFALAGRAQARRHAHRELGRDLDDETRRQLDALLTDRTDWDGPSLFGWIGEVPEGRSQKNLAGVVERLRCVRAIGLTDDRRKRIHANRYAMIAREAKVTQARELLRVSEVRRTAVLVAFAIERQAALTDLAIEMFDKLIGAAHRRAETVRKTRQLERADAMETFARNHLALCHALIAAREDGRPLAGAIERTLGWNGVAADADEIARALGRSQGDGLDELIGRRLALRRAARVIFDAFKLRSFKTNDPILQAVGLLRSLYVGERTRLPAKVPVIFLKQRWRNRVRAGMHDFDPRAWEVAVLVHLRDRLRSGDVWVEGSRAYRTFEDYLAPVHYRDTDSR